MTRDAQDAYLMGAAEALLFVSDEPVSSSKLGVFLNVTPEAADELLARLKDEYEQDNRGMQLREVAGGWRFFSHPAYHELIEKYVVSWDTRRMSQAALEALAVIAYHQPVTRASINAIRGVNSEGVVSSLVEKGLIREAGREKGGGAILYATTRAFLEKFGLKSTKDLPPLEDFAPDEATREFIRQRLGATDDLATVDDEEHALSDADDLRGLELVVVDDAQAQVVDVDRGEEPRVDEPQAVADIIAQALTDKVDFAEPEPDIVFKDGACANPDTAPEEGDRAAGKGGVDES